MMELPIPLDEAACQPIAKKPRIDGAGAAEAEEFPEISHEACLRSYFADSTVTCRNPSLDGSVEMTQSLYLKTCPRYLMVKLNRYYVDDQWRQIKIRNGVDMPEVLDLGGYRSPGDGLLLGETPMPSEEEHFAHAPAAAPSAPYINEDLVPELVSLGFSEHGVRRALQATRSSDLEVAMNYILEHLDDAGFNDPVLSTPLGAAAGSATAATAGAAAGVSAEAVDMLSSMGFSADQAAAALLSAGQDVER